MTIPCKDITVLTPPEEPPTEPPVIIIPAATHPIITPEEAAEGIKQGKQYYIKSALPWFDMLPGVPYIEGTPILPWFRISVTT